MHKKSSADESWKNPYGLYKIQQHRLTVHIDVFKITAMKKLVLTIAIILAL